MLSKSPGKQKSIDLNSDLPDPVVLIMSELWNSEQDGEGQAVGHRCVATQIHPDLGDIASSVPDYYNKVNIMVK